MTGLLNITGHMTISVDDFLNQLSAIVLFSSVSINAFHCQCISCIIQSDTVVVFFVHCILFFKNQLYSSVNVSIVFFSQYLSVVFFSQKLVVFFSQYLSVVMFFSQYFKWLGCMFVFLAVYLLQLVAHGCCYSYFARCMFPLLQQYIFIFIFASCLPFPRESVHVCCQGVQSVAVQHCSLLLFYLLLRFTQDKANITTRVNTGFENIFKTCVND